MKLPIPLLATACAVICANLSPAASLTTWNATVDTGQYCVGNWVSGGYSGSARIDYGGDLDYVTFRWTCNSGAFWGSTGKHYYYSGAPFYPKAADSVGTGTWCSYNTYVESVSGQHQSGMYVWLDDNNSYWGTHELNVWNYGNNTTYPSDYTWVGVYNADGSNYNVYKKWNTEGPGFQSWYFLRQSWKRNFSLDVKPILTWLRQRQLPNHNVTAINPAQEGFPGSNGAIAFTSIYVSNL